MEVRLRPFQELALNLSHRLLRPHTDLVEAEVAVEAVAAVEAAEAAEAVEAAEAAVEDHSYLKRIR